MQEKQDHPAREPSARIPEGPSVSGFCAPALDRCPLAMAFVTGQAHITGYANPALTRLCGRPLEDIQGHTFADVLPGSLSARLRARLDFVLSTAEPDVICDQPQYHPEKGMVYWSYTIWPVLNENRQA